MYSSSVQSISNCSDSAFPTPQNALRRTLPSQLNTPLQCPNNAQFGDTTVQKEEGMN
jgi:hypothetical protein